MRRSAAGRFLAMLALAAVATPSAAQEKPRTFEEFQQRADKVGETAEKVGGAAGKLATQPAKDVGISKTEIPPLLVEASHNPYSLARVNTCSQLASAVADLNAVLGPDYQPAEEPKSEDKAAALANAGGNAVLSAIIPFRGVVREVSGAAPAQRAYNAAVDAGLARRGFLRGVHTARNCKTGF